MWRVDLYSDDMSRPELNKDNLGKKFRVSRVENRSMGGTTIV